MRHVHETEVVDELEFARRAGAKFAADKSLWSYSDEEIQPGILLALRWGLGNDCVLVTRLHDYFLPTVYAQMARARTESGPTTGSTQETPQP